PANRADAEGLGPGLTPVYPQPDDLVVDVTLPSGERLAATDPLLVERLAGRGADVSDLSLIRSDRALTDCRPVSLISHHTIQQIGDELGVALDRRRFRANIFAELGAGKGFGEDAFVGKRLQIGTRCVIAVLDRDPRCKMISIDPETAEEHKDVFGHVSRAHDGCAGIYCAVLTEGMVRADDAIVLLDRTQAGGVTDLKASLIERGSRGGQRPASTSVMKRSTVSLNSAGSSRLSTWPDFGNMARPEPGKCRFRNRLGSMQLSSSSPQMISVGVGTFRIASVSV